MSEQQESWVTGHFPAEWSYTRLPNALLLDPSLSDSAVRLWMLLCHLAFDQKTDTPMVGVEEARAMIGMSVRPWNRARSELVEAGLLTVGSRRGFARPNLYTVLLPGQNATMGSAETHDPGSAETHDPSYRDLKTKSLASLDSGREPAIPGPKAVDRKKVTDAELTFAHTVLAAWNGRTGQSLTANGWLSKIIMRHREHPEVTPQEHVGIIDRNLADPWWKGPATPSVIYGSDDQFERAMQVTGEVKRKETAIERWQRERERSERQRSNGDPDLLDGRVPPALEERTVE